MKKLNRNQAQDLSGLCYGTLNEIPTDGTRPLIEVEMVIDGSENGDLKEFLQSSAEIKAPNLKL